MKYPCRCAVCTGSGVATCGTGRGSWDDRPAGAGVGNDPAGLVVVVAVVAAVVVAAAAAADPVDPVVVVLVAVAAGACLDYY